jgi:hypothetical protein
MAAPATLPEIDEALANIAKGLRTGSHEYREVALAYADTLLDKRLMIHRIVAAWDKATNG